MLEFNQEIEATAFAGEIRADISTMKGDIHDIKSDVRWLRDNVKPIVMVVGGVPTVISLVALAQSLGIL